MFGFKNLMKKATRTKGKYSLTYLEALETRELMTVSVADGAGTWTAFGALAGSITIAADKSVTAATAFGDGTNTFASGDLTFNLSATSGLANIKTKVSDDVTVNYDGIMNSDKSMINISNSDNPTKEAVLVKASAGLTNDILKGTTWAYSFSGANGTITFAVDKSGVLSVSKVTMIKNGVAVAGATATVTLTDGGGSVADTISITIKDKSGSTLTVLEGVANTTRDTLVMKNAGGVLVIATKTASGFTANDLVPAGDSTKWYVTGNGGTGSLYFTTPVTAKGFNISEDSDLTIKVGSTLVEGTPSGILTISAAGVVSGNIVLNANTWAATKINLTGYMNAAKNTIQLYSADGVVSMILTTSADHVNTVGQLGKTSAMALTTADNGANAAGAVIGGSGITMTFDQVKTYMGYVDIDNDTTSTIYLKAIKGTLVVDDTEYTSASAHYVAITKDSVIKWYTDTTVSVTAAEAVLSATLVNSDTPEAAKIVKLAAKRAADPVTIAAIAGVKVTTADVDGKAAFTLTRTTTGANSIVLTPGTGDTYAKYTDDYTLDVDADSKTGGASLTYADGKITVAFTAESTLKTAKIIVKSKVTAASATLKTIAMTLDTPTYKGGYELGAPKTASVNLNGSGTAITLTAVTVPSAATLTEGSYIDFVAMRAATNSAEASFTIDITGLATADYTLYKVVGTTETAVVGGSSKFDAAETKVTIRVKLKNNNIVDAVSTVTVGITPQVTTVGTGYYVVNTLSYKTADNEVVVSSVAANNATIDEKQASTTKKYSSTYTITAAKPAADDTKIYFVLSGTTAIPGVEGADYTISDNAISTANEDAPGEYYVIMKKGATTATVTVTSKADNLFSEGNQTIILTLEADPTAAEGTTAYTLPATKAATVTITDNAANTAPTATAVTSATTYTIQDTTAVEITGAALLTACKASDNEDGTAVTLALTSISDKVSIKIGETTYTKTSDLSAISIKSDTVLKVSVLKGATATVGTATAVLFKFKAVDSQSLAGTEVNYSAKMVKETTAPTIGATVVFEDAVIVGSAGSLLTGLDLFSKVTASDNITAIEDLKLRITSIAAGISLKIGSTTYTSATAAATLTAISIASTTEITVTAAATATKGDSVKVFSVKVVDEAGNFSATASDVKMKVAVNTKPTLAEAENPQVVVTTDKMFINQGNLATFLTVTDDFTDYKGVTFTITLLSPAVGTLKIGGADYNATTNKTFTWASLSNVGTVQWTQAAGAVEVTNLAIFKITATDAGGLVSDALTFKVDLIAAPAEG